MNVFFFNHPLTRRDTDKGPPGRFAFDTEGPSVNLATGRIEDWTGTPAGCPAVSVATYRLVRRLRKGLPFGLPGARRAANSRPAFKGSKSDAVAVVKSFGHGTLLA
jgi:hypothetical protein